MEYSYFIGMVKQFESKYVKAYEGNQICSATASIPKPFGLLIGEIVSILDRNIDKFCSNDELLAIIGLQPMGMMVTSSRPIFANRIINPQNSHQHFCCSLEYQVMKQGAAVNYWERTKLLVIDFTTGEIMNNENYLRRLNPEIAASKGVIYGIINQTLMNTVWQIIRIRQRSKLPEVA